MNVKFSVMLSVPAAGRQGDDGQGDGGGGDRERVTIVCSNSPNTLLTLLPVSRIFHEN